MGLVAMVTVASFEAVGSILVVAMLIVPAATAHLLTDRLFWMLVLATVIGIAAAVFGYIGDVWWQSNVAATSAGAVGGLFLAALLFAPRQGLLSKSYHHIALKIQIVAEDIVAVLFRSEESSSRVPERISLRHCLAAAGTGPKGWLAVPWLWLRGDVRIDEKRLSLTDQGRTRARSLVRSHRLWESYLGEQFDLPLDHLHEAAERIEHYIGPELQREIAAGLDKPGSDPHGRQIPPPA
jgi:hypothetical protein